jgi:hypothetical protein
VLDLEGLPATLIRPVSVSDSRFANIGEARRIRDATGVTWSNVRINSRG